VTAKRKPPRCADSVALEVLLEEFGTNDHAESERKIRRRLRDNKLGPYLQDRISMLRRLRNELVNEVCRCGRSRYFLGGHGCYANLNDFDIARMAEDWAGLYPEVPKEVIAAFLPGVVYLYYMR
jgi:hypothetical protein